MDVAFCVIEQEGDSSKVTFAGAKRPLYYVISGDSELIEIKGSKRSIGGFHGEKKIFENHKITLPTQSVIYLTTDGMADQHNIEGKKIGSLQMKQFFAKIAYLPMKQQHEKLEWFLSSHQREQFQRDDITLVGIRV